MPTYSGDSDYSGSATYTPTSFEVSQNQELGGRPMTPGGGLASSIGQVAGGLVGTALSSGGCSGSPLIQRINAFLDYGGGAGRSAVSVAAGLATEDPLVVFGVNAALSDFQNSTEGDCGTPTATYPASNTGNLSQQTAALLDPSSGLASGAQLTDVENSLESYLNTLLQWVGAYTNIGLVPYHANGGFLVKAPWASIDVGTDRPDPYVGLHAYGLSTREVGESLVDWLNRIGATSEGSWSAPGSGPMVWAVDDSGMVSSSVSVEGYWGSFYAVWYGVPMAASDTDAWMRDFAVYYKFQSDDAGPWFSVMGFMAWITAANGQVPGTVTGPPYAIT